MAAVVVAAGVAACGGSPAPAATVTVTASASATTAASPSPTPSAATSTQLVVAVASGPKANGISAVNGSGTVKQLVAPSGGPIRDLAWAPGGVRLAFLRAVSDTNMTSSLFVYNARTQQLYQVGVGIAPANVESFAWVGATQLVASYFPVGARSYHANGTLWLRDVAKSSGAVVKDSAGHVLKGVAVSSSADGVRLAFVTYGAASSAMIAEHLRVYDADNLSVSTVAAGKAPVQEDGDQFSYPSISPDGSLVYTTQTGSDPGFRCTVYDLTGATRLSAGDLIWPTRGAWTSLGRLAFGGGDARALSTAQDSLRVWSSGSGAARTVLIVTKLPITSVAWTPKASQIGYTVAHPNGMQSSLWIVNADGSNRHLLLADGSYPAWAIAPVTFP